jgi:membrane associated rhomboid family serine protease/DNA-binding beta-propeller fold protein YncE
MENSPMSAAPEEQERIRFPYVTIALVLVNVLVYVAQSLSGVPWDDRNAEQTLAWGGNLAARTLTGESWRLLTNIFVHGGLLHVALNMYLLVVVGPRVERRFGVVGAIVIYFAGGMLASAVSAWWFGRHAIGVNLLGMQVTRMVVSAGASGAILAMCGGLLARLAIDSVSGREVPAETGLGKALVQVVGVTVVMGLVDRSIDQAAHVGGLIAGVALGVVLSIGSGHRLASRAARSGVAICATALVVWLTLHADWSELREVRASLDQETAAKQVALAAEAAGARRKHAAEQDKSLLPVPVSEQAARGRTVQFGDSGVSFALSKDEKTAYVVDHYKNEISAIDVPTGAIKQRIAGSTVPELRADCQFINCGGPQAADIALLQDKPLALVSSMYENSVAFVDLSTGRVQRKVQVGRVPNAIVLSPDQRRAYVHNTADATISVIDIENASNVGLLPLHVVYPAWPPGMRMTMWFSMDGGRLLVGNLGGQQIDAFDTKTLKAVGGEAPDYGLRYAVQMEGAGDEVIGYRADGNLASLDRESGRLKREWAFCEQITPIELAASRVKPGLALMAVARIPDGGTEAQEVSVTNLESLVPIGRYPVKGFVMKLRFSGDGSKLYAVLNNGTLSVIDLAQRMASSELICSVPGK